MSGQAAAPPVAVVTREDDATGTARGGAPGLCGVIAQMRGRTVPQLVQRLSTTALSIRRNPIRHLQKMQSTIHHLERAARQCVANALPKSLAWALWRITSCLLTWTLSAWPFGECSVPRCQLTRVYARPLCLGSTATGSSCSKNILVRTEKRVTALVRTQQLQHSFFVHTVSNLPPHCIMPTDTLSQPRRCLTRENLTVSSSRRWQGSFPRVPCGQRCLLSPPVLSRVVTC